MKSRDPAGVLAVQHHDVVTLMPLACMPGTAALQLRAGAYIFRVSPFHQHKREETASRAAGMITRRTPRAPQAPAKSETLKTRCPCTSGVLTRTSSRGAPAFLNSRSLNISAASNLDKNLQLVCVPSGTCDRCANKTLSFFSISTVIHAAALYILNTLWKFTTTNMSALKLLSKRRKMIQEKCACVSKPR